MKFLIPPLFFLLLASCSSTSKKEDEKEKPKVKTGPEKRIVGRIASVSHAREFVLIQKFGTGTLPKEVIYQSQGPDGRTASLRPSGERVRDFYAADLLNGNAQKGDAVLGYPDPVKKDPNSSETLTNVESEDKATTSPEIKSNLQKDPKTP